MEENFYNNNDFILTSDNGKTSTRWMATIFKDDELNILINHKDIKYWCYGIEYAPSTGLKHYQAYFETNKICRFSYIKKNILYTSHFSQAIKCANACINYCKKLDSKKDINDFYEKCNIESIKHQGERNDLKTLVNEVKCNKSLKEIIESNEDLALNVDKVIKLRNLMIEPRDYAPECFVYWGVSGSGKTYKAHSENKDAYYLML